MRRSKKSLGRAILVSLLSASMVMTTPVYAAEYHGVTDKVTGDVTDGINADGASNVTITGTVSGNEEEGQDITIQDKSNITVNGDVDCSNIYVKEKSTLTVGGKVTVNKIWNSEGNVSIDGDVIIKNDDDRNAIGVDTSVFNNNGTSTNATTNVGGNVDVTIVGGLLFTRNLA